nr:hypothetical protein [bacterium]
MSIFWIEGKRLFVQSGMEKMVIEPWGDNALRVRCTREADFPAHNGALLPAA